MATKLVSPRSVQKIVVLDQLRGPVTVHKRRSKQKKAERAFMKAFSRNSLKSPVRMLKNMTDVVRLASGVRRLQRPFGSMPAPIRRIKFGW